MSMLVTALGFLRRCDLTQVPRRASGLYVANFVHALDVPRLFGRPSRSHCAGVPPAGSSSPRPPCPGGVSSVTPLSIPTWISDPTPAFLTVP
jgi:hypothetical protein